MILGKSVSDSGVINGQANYIVSTSGSFEPSFCFHSNSYFKQIFTFAQKPNHE